MPRLISFKNGARINTSAQLIALFAFTISVNLWEMMYLFLSFTILIVFIITIKNMHFYQLIKRLKWFYLVMFLIFLFNTPGEHIPDWPLFFTPSYEGLQMGIIQLLRITTILAFLSVILFKNTKNELIAGVYFLIKPLSNLGFDVKRFSSRLWLTLYYVDLQDNNKTKPMLQDLQASLSKIFSENEIESDVIDIELPVFYPFDYVIVFVSLTLLVFSLLKQV
jgi:hypothetical protein